MPVPATPRRAALAVLSILAAVSTPVAADAAAGTRAGPVAATASATAIGTGSELDGLRPLVAERLGAKAEDLQLRALPDSGLIEVFNAGDSRISYVDPQVHTVFLGSLFDAAGHRNLTEQREHELNRIPFEAVPKERAIKVVKGKGTLQFAVFEDPDCPFCRQMEAKLEDFDDYTVYILLLPLTDLHPQAEVAAKAIWCADDPTAAWHAYLSTRRLPPARECSTPIAELRKLADRHRVGGTPTLVMPDGELVEGLPTLATLKWKLSHSHPAGS